MGNPEGILGQDYWQTVKTKQDQYVAARTGRWALHVVRPSIFTTSAGSRQQRQLRGTAYLDGLRGFAAMLVYIGHHELWAHEAVNPEKIFENVFGFQQQYYFCTLPGVRMFFAGGHFAVSVFFVMSGYVLSTKPLQHIHSGDHTKLGDNLASALFRRWLRLFIPVIAVSFLYMASWHVLGVRVDNERKETFRAELWNFYTTFKNYSFIFHHTPTFQYNFPVWSIPTEFKGSIVVYTTLLALSRARRNARLWCTVLLILYFLYIVDGWYCAMFVMGMLQCDLDLLAANNNLPASFARLTGLKKPIFYTMFALGIYLGGCPASDAEGQTLRASPGWYYMSYLKPQAMWDYKWFYLFCAASMTVPSIPRIPLLKRFFELRFNQYLGRISFAFYLVHGPVMWTIADRLYAASGCIRGSHGATAARWINMAPIPSLGPLGLELNFLVPHLLIFPITLWMGEIATKLFDEPSVRFSQWLYQRTLDSSEKS